MNRNEENLAANQRGNETVVPSALDHPFYEMNIRKADNGLIVNVGCKIFVFESHQAFLLKLGEYLSDHKGVIKKFYDNNQRL